MFGEDVDIAQSTEQISEQTTEQDNDVVSRFETQKDVLEASIAEQKELMEYIKNNLDKFRLIEGVYVHQEKAHSQDINALGEEVRKEIMSAKKLVDIGLSVYLLPNDIKVVGGEINSYKKTPDGLIDNSAWLEIKSVETIEGTSLKTRLNDASKQGDVILINFLSDKLKDVKENINKSPLTRIKERANGFFAIPSDRINNKLIIMTVNNDYFVAYIKKDGKVSTNPSLVLRGITLSYNSSIENKTELVKVIKNGINEINRIKEEQEQQSIRFQMKTEAEVEAIQARKKAIKNAVKNKQWVDTKFIEEFANEKWAGDELLFRQWLQENPDIYSIAKNTKTFEEFLETMKGKRDDDDNPLRKSYYERIYNYAHTQTSRQKDKTFLALNTSSEDALIKLASSLDTIVDGLWRGEIDPKLLAQVDSEVLALLDKRKRKIEKYRRQARQKILANPRLYRRLLGEYDEVVEGKYDTSSLNEDIKNELERISNSEENNLREGELEESITNKSRFVYAAFGMNAFYVNFFVAFSFCLLESGALEPMCLVFLDQS